MIIAIDIGNTSISCALMKGKRVIREVRVNTTLSSASLRRDAGKVLRSLKRGAKIESVMICSVVPRALKVVQAAVRREVKITPLIAGRNIKIPIKNKYRHPKQVGADRLVCAYAAMKLYRAPCIIIDLGTAITLDVVSKRGEYLGGIIVPGIRLSVDSLFAKAAMLPKVTIRKPRALIGKDTQSSILSGIFHGYGEMLTGLIHVLSKKVKGKPSVVVTGGYTDLMRKYIKKSITSVDENLVFKGLYFLHKGDSHF